MPPKARALLERQSCLARCPSLRTLSAIRQNAIAQVSRGTAMTTRLKGCRNYPTSLADSRCNCGRVSTPAKALRARVSDSSQRFDHRDALHRFDGRRDLRRQLVAIAPLDVGLAAVLQLEHKGDLRVPSGFETFCDAVDGIWRFEINAQSLLRLCRGLIQGLDRLDARAHIIALRFGGQEQEHRGSRLEQVAVLREAFLKDHSLV